MQSGDPGRGQNVILRAIILAGGLAGGAVTSQFPEFSQQYLQRLGGAVDALEDVTADFDATAQSVGLSRDDALAQMTGTPFLDRRRLDMTTTFQRHDALSAALAKLEGQGPFMRAYYLPQMRDTQIAKAAWAVYQPAVPLNLAGLIFAGAGFLFGAIALGFVFRLFAMPFRRSKAIAD